MQYIWTSIFAGAFGGLLHTIYYNNYRLPLPRIERNDGTGLSMGFLGDVLLGIGAALVTTFLVGELQFAKQVALSLLAGFGGGSFLGSFESKMRESFLNEKLDKLDKGYKELTNIIEQSQENEPVYTEEGDVDAKK